LQNLGISPHTEHQDESKPEGAEASPPAIRRRSLGGVAAGLARYFAVDVAHVRIILVALSFLAGAAVPLYLAAWVLIPAEGSGTAIADEVLNHAGSHSS